MHPIDALLTGAFRAVARAFASPYAALYVRHAAQVIQDDWHTGPTDPTAEGQIEVINSLIAQGVDAIAISANDPDALVPALKRAMDRGITVISWDSANSSKKIMKIGLPM